MASLKSRPVIFESLDARRLLSGTVWPTPTLTAAAGTATVLAAAVSTRHVYMTGNSMTDGVSYQGLASLLGTTGSTITLGRQTGPGYSQWANANLYPGYTTGGIDPARPTVGNPWGNYKDAFAATSWDVLTIQPHDRRLQHDVWEAGHDEGEIPNSMVFLRAMAANNSKGQVFVYSRAARRTDVDASNVSTGLPFDYSKEWLKTYDDAAIGNTEGTVGNELPYASRSRMTQLMPLLRAAQKADAATKNLPAVRFIPVGEAYYNVDQAIKAGKFSGTAVHSMLDLYRDQSHPTEDVAAYLTALTFYSSITGRDPRGVKPSAEYLKTGSKVADTNVQALLQQAVYDAMTSPYYSAYTTPLPTTPLPPSNNATFRGYVINDKNGNGKWDTGEAGVIGRTVWVDLDNDGKLDTNEPTTKSTTNGKFEFTGLAKGTVYIREILPTGVTQILPTKNAALTATLSAGQIKSGQYFATKAK